MNKSEMKEMLVEEREGLGYEKESIKNRIGTYQIEFTRIEDFINLLNKLPGDSIIEKIDRNELYDLRNYYLKSLNDVSEILIDEKKYLKELNDQLDKLLIIQMYL